MGVSPHYQNETTSVSNPPSPIIDRARLPSNGIVVLRIEPLLFRLGIVHDTDSTDDVEDLAVRKGMDSFGVLFRAVVTMARDGEIEDVLLRSDDLHPVDVHLHIDMH